MDKDSSLTVNAQNYKLVYTRATQLNQMLATYTSNHLEYQFMQAFVQKFNQEKNLASLVATRKIDLAKNKKEKIFNVFRAIVKDALSLFQVPTETLDTVVGEAVADKIQDQRNEGYENSAQSDVNQTHVELLSQALAYALILHFHTIPDKQLVNQAADAEERGKKAATRLARGLKDKSIQLSSSLEPADKVKALLQYVLDKELMRKETNKYGTKVDISEFSANDFWILLAFSAANLFTFDRMYFIEISKLKQDVAVIATTTQKQERDINVLKAQGQKQESALDALETRGEKQGNAIDDLRNQTKKQEQQLDDLEKQDRNSLGIVEVKGNYEKKVAAAKLTDLELLENCSEQTEKTATKLVEMLDNQYSKFLANIPQSTLEKLSSANANFPQPKLKVDGDMIETTVPVLPGEVKMVERKEKELEVSDEPEETMESLLL